jgi:hypothetical protein
MNAYDAQDASEGERRAFLLEQLPVRVCELFSSVSTWSSTFARSVERVLPTFVLCTWSSAADFPVPSICGAPEGEGSGYGGVRHQRVKAILEWQSFGSVL